MTSPAPRLADPVRVLWLIKGLGPGGAEALLVNSARVTDLERFQLEVAYVRPDKDQLVAPLREAGVSCHLVGQSPNGQFLWPARLRRLLAAGHFDIVHVHSPLPAGVVRMLVRSMPRSRRPAVVTTEHNEWDSFALPTRLLNGATARLDDHRWAVSGPVQRSMWPAVATGTEVLVQGIDLQAREPAPDARQRIRAELGLSDEAVVACTVANLRREKDYPNLMAASALAFPEAPALYVLAVGQGPLRPQMDTLHVDLALGDRFRFLGYRADTADLLAAADLFVLGSAHEGYPLALMEALAQGLPVVATAVGGIPDAVHSGIEGVLVPPRDAQALARALVEVTADPELRQRMGTAAKSASKQFDIRSAVERQCAVYAELAAGRRRRLSTLRA